MKVSLQKKLLYSFMVIVVVMLVGTMAGISMLLREYIMDAKRQELMNKGTELVRIVADYQEERLTANQFNSLLSSVDRFLDARVWLVDPSRKILAISSSKQGISPHMGMGPGMGANGAGMGMGGPGGAMRMLGNGLDVVLGGQVWTSTFYHPFYEEDMLIVALPVTKNGAVPSGAVILNAPVKGLQQSLGRMYFYIAAVGAVAIILALALVHWLSKGIVRPLGEMRETAIAMAAGNYDRRVAVTTNDEVGDLGSSLNALTSDLSTFVSQTERMEKLRRDFIANVSHELRTPLTIIRGYSEALLDDTISDHQESRKYCRLIRDEAERLERLNRDLLDLSRLQADNTALERERLPLAAISNGVVQLFMRPAEQKRIDLQFHGDEGLPEIWGSGDRLTQLLVILLDNAIKFTPCGGTVTVRVYSEEGKVLLTVADTGTGIPTADLEYVWERFYKVDKSHSRLSDGTGLGLAIAREIISLHEGECRITSSPGAGTVFTVAFSAIK